MRSEIIEILACPICKKKLNYQGERSGFRCPKCQEIYEIISGVPLLLSKERNEELHKLLAEEESSGMLSEYLKRQGFLDTLSKKIFLPDILLHARSQFKKHIQDKLYHPSKDRAIVLNVGGGPLREDPRETNLNIGFFPNVDIVADGYNIPFLDNSCDTVICKAVLEHVEYPQKIMDEIYRVLKKGGYVYIEVPFLFAYHAYPSDYYRYTKTGLEKLCFQFEKAEDGITIGPTSAALLFFVNYLSLFTPAGNKLLRKIASAIFKIIFFPLKYLDLFLNKRDDACKFSGGFYYLGRK